MRVAHASFAISLAAALALVAFAASGRRTSVTMTAYGGDRAEPTRTFRLRG